MSSRCVCVALVACLSLAFTAAGQVVYVDASAPAGGDGSSWGSAFRSLQDGLSAARSSLAIREVRVAGGQYTPGPVGDRTASFRLVAGVALRGGYGGIASAHPDERNLRGTPSVLSGDLGGNDVEGAGRGDRTENSYHVVTAVGLHHRAVIDGFHVTGGRADGAGAGENRGGGVYVDQCGENVVFSRCVVRDNEATVGGGMMVLDTAAKITQCVVVGNRAHAWSGLRCESMRIPVIPTVEYSTFVYNVCFDGDTSGISSIGVAPSTNPSFPGEIVPLRLVLNSCISAFNARSTLTAIPQQITGYFTAHRCLALRANGWVVEDNVVGEPLFVDAAGPDGHIGSADDDLRLQPGSVGIDQGGAASLDHGDTDGDGDSTDVITLDIDGSERVFGSQTDIGASEGPVLMAVVTAVPTIVAEGGSVQLPVRLARRPVGVVRLAFSVAAVGGSGPAVVPVYLDLGPSDWNLGTEVTVSWPVDGGLTDDQTDLVISGTEVATARQRLIQIDSTTPQGVVYVNPQAALPADGAGWASGYRTIEEALAVAAQQPAVRQVWVKSGTYRPPLPAGASDQSARVYRLPKGVMLTGGFAGSESSASQRVMGAHPTVINGDNLGDDGSSFANYNDNCSNLLISIDPDDRTGIDGIDFTRAKSVAVSASDTAAGLPPGENQLRVINCRFMHNRFGALGLSDCTGNIVVAGCVFESNGHTQFGIGALAIRQRAGEGAGRSVTVRGCEFRGNSGSTGSGLRFEGRTLNIEECLFENNTVSPACRIALFDEQIERAAFACVQDCAFNGNSSLTYGGALEVLYTNANGPSPTYCFASICDSTFHANTAFSAAAIYSGGSPTSGAEVRRCSFAGNSSQGQYGAVRNGKYYQCEFIGNSSAQFGAGPQYAVGCLFDSNSATQDSGVGRQGQYWDCIFIRNNAPMTGALSESEVYGCLFEYNSATAGSYGAMNGGRALDSVFLNNTATLDGGAGLLVEAVRCRFGGNTAGRNGGGLVQSERVISSLFTANQAGGAGGAAYGVRFVLNATVYGNNAATVGGVDAVGSWATSVSQYVWNSIFWGNISASGTVEQMQLRQRVGVRTESFESRSAANVSIGTQWNGGTLILGPLSGGMTRQEVDAAVTNPLEGPFVQPYASATPTGGLSAMTPGGGLQEKWISILSPGMLVMPSAVLRMGLGTAPGGFASAEWSFKFAADGQVGDPDVPGLYMHGQPLPQSVGGSFNTQTEWTFDVSDTARKNEVNWFAAYLRNDSGYAGIRYRSKISFLMPYVGRCIVQGLSQHTGHANIGSDPMLLLINGFDGVLGTADDDATPSGASPAIDSGNSRMLALDELDLDSDGDLRELIAGDLEGNQRVTDLPLPNQSIGVLTGLDRGAIEVTGTEALFAPPCRADIGSRGGAVGADGLLDINDFVIFIDAFFLSSPIADVGVQGAAGGSDGRFDNNDFIVFIDRFFAGC